MSTTIENSVLDYQEGWEKEVKETERFPLFLKSIHNSFHYY